MTMPGQTLDTLVRNVWAPELYTEVFKNSWLFNQQYFQIKPALGGDVISTGYRYLVTSNAAAFNYDDPMVEPYVASDIKAYFNKQSFQEAARIFNSKLYYRQNGGYEPSSIDYVRDTLKEAMINLYNIATTTMLAQLEAQIDSASAYSDASLSRTTYAALKSYEEDSSASLSLAYLEDLVENLLLGTTYGVNIRDKSDLLFLTTQNQITNLSRLAGVQYMEFNASSQGGPIDMGRVFRTQAFEGIQIAAVPGLTNTTWLCVNRPDIIIHETEPFLIEEKQEAAHTQLWKLTGGWNIEARRPNNHAKLSNKTA